MKKIISLILAVLLVLGTGTLLAGCQQKDTVGNVYYLNFKPEFNDALKALAEKYTQATGVEVKVVTAAAGDYATTLNAQMGKSGAPTVYNIGNMADLADWDDYALDLTGTKLEEELTTKEFNLYNEAGQLKAMGFCYESYGIIVNTKLLKELGHDLSEITDFATLKAVVADITAKKPETGVSAFTSAGLDDSSSWRFSGHLANMPLYYEFRDENITGQPSAIKGSYLPQLKNIWDLYIQNATCDPGQLPSKTGDNAKAEFTSGKAVFYQNGTWEYAGLLEAGMKPEDLAMIPIYIGVEGEEKAGLCSGTETRWAINSKASQTDIDATIDFLYWLVTDAEASKVLVEQLGAVPFRNCLPSNNKFIVDGSKLLSDGHYAVSWAFNYTPNVDSWRATVVTALAAYSAGSGSWENVRKAVVDGWAYEYSVVNP